MEKLYKGYKLVAGALRNTGMKRNARIFFSIFWSSRMGRKARVHASMNTAQPFPDLVYPALRTKYEQAHLKEGQHGHGDGAKAGGVVFAEKQAR